MPSLTWHSSNTTETQPAGSKVLIWWTLLAECVRDRDDDIRPVFLKIIFHSLHYNSQNTQYINLLKPNDIYIYMSYRSANLQTLHFKYLFNKYKYWIL